MHSHNQMDLNMFQPVVFTLFVIVLFLYVQAVIITNRTKRNWPNYRIFLWILGLTCAFITFTGPLADHAHTDFSVHMIGHLFLGMLSPLFIALSAPMTLFLRTLPVSTSRRVTRALRNKFFQFFHQPLTASILNVGGLWLLYTTDLFVMMHQNMYLYVLIHLHIFLAGYLFTISLLYIDPPPNQKSYPYRSVVFLLAITGHAVLSKYIYVNPPRDVPRDQAELGGMIMYYGGDAIEVGMIFLLFYQWFKQTRSTASLSNRPNIE